jgi:type I restriction enzyme S subunit
MEEWKNCYIGDVCSTISETYKANSSEVVLVNTSDVLEGKCLNHIKVDNKDLKGQFKKAFHQNDILYSEIRPANKRFAFIDFEPTDYIASTKLMVIRNNESILPEYLFYILQSKTVIEELQMLAESRSGTFPQITFSEVSRMQIKLPNTEEQIKILGVLKSLDKKIELNRRINDNLEQQAQALFKSWFVDFEPFKDGKFVDSELGMIPEGWKVCAASDIFDINIGKTPPRKEQEWFSTEKNQNVTWVSISDMGNNGMFISDSSEYLTKEAVSKFNIIIVPNNTILLSFKLTIGRVAICNSELTTNEAIARFYLPNDSFREYLYLALKDYDYTKLGSTSSIATAVNSKIIKNMLMLSPGNKVIQKFSSLVNPLFETIKLHQDEICNLSLERDTLLPKLMSGELKINDLNN